MSVKLLTDHHLEFLSLHVTGGCTGSSEPTLVKKPHCWKLHVMAHILFRNHPTTEQDNNIFWDLVDKLKTMYFEYLHFQSIDRLNNGCMTQLTIF